MSEGKVSAGKICGGIFIIILSIGFLVIGTLFINQERFLASFCFIFLAAPLIIVSIMIFFTENLMTESKLYCIIGIACGISSLSCALVLFFLGPLDPFLQLEPFYGLILIPDILWIFAFFAAGLVSSIHSLETNKTNLGIAGLVFNLILIPVFVILASSVP